MKLEAEAVLLAVLGRSSVAEELGAAPWRNCEDVAPETLTPGESCWSRCTAEFTAADDICDPTVAAWSGTLFMNERVIALADRTDCPANLTRALCTVKRSKTKLCTDAADHSLVPGDVCWTSCGERECPPDKLEAAIHGYTGLMQTRDLKLSDCPGSSTYRRRCEVEQ